MVAVCRAALQVYNTVSILQLCILRIKFYRAVLTPYYSHVPEQVALSVCIATLSRRYEPSMPPWVAAAERAHFGTAGSLSEQS